MKRILLAVLAVAALHLPAKAATTPAQPVRGTVTNGVACSTQTITTTAVELTGNTTGYTTTPGVYNILIMNLDTGTTVYTSDNLNVAPSGLWGVPIAPNPATSQKNALSFGISAIQKWYAVAVTGNVAISTCLWR